ncbi:hypothetical protein [Devosia sp.]|uniref:hypothetical protein n=1 Tax=Devosia sp. TaxID=1871048 RepID=UPI0025E3F91B|nr:hypothetical protein [Devosia sp.]MCR6634245.1 hypothetical protein [Devosia sp.]
MLSFVISAVMPRAVPFVTRRMILRIGPADIGATLIVASEAAITASSRRFSGSWLMKAVLKPF